MGNGKKGQSDDEIEGEVLATRDDPTQREFLPSEPPPSSRQPERARENQRNGVPLMPGRPKGHPTPSMETVNKLRDAK